MVTAALPPQAVAWAAVDAALHRCRLEIVTSFAIPFGFGPSVTVTQDNLDQLCGDAERVLDEATRVARAAAPDVALAISTEPIDEPIIPALLTRSKQARMLVVGGRGLGAVRRVLLGSVSAAVARPLPGHGGAHISLCIRTPMVRGADIRRFGTQLRQTSTGQAVWCSRSRLVEPNNSAVAVGWP